MKELAEKILEYGFLYQDDRQFSDEYNRFIYPLKKHHYFMLSISRMHNIFGTHLDYNYFMSVIEISESTDFYGTIFDAIDFNTFEELVNLLERSRCGQYIKALKDPRIKLN